MKVCRAVEGEDHLLDSQWTYLLRAFGIPEEDCLTDVAAIGDTPVVVIQPQAGVNVQGESTLAEFVHPTDCCYLFGASHGIMPAGALDGLNVVARVYIPLDGDWELFAPQAAAIVLWDRMLNG